MREGAFSRLSGSLRCAPDQAGEVVGDDHVAAVLGIDRLVDRDRAVDVIGLFQLARADHPQGCRIRDPLEPGFEQGRGLVGPALPDQQRIERADGLFVLRQIGDQRAIDRLGLAGSFSSTKRPALSRLQLRVIGRLGQLFGPDSSRAAFMSPAAHAGLHDGGHDRGIGCRRRRSGPAGSPPSRRPSPGAASARPRGRWPRAAHPRCRSARSWAMTRRRAVPVALAHPHIGQRGQQGDICGETRRASSSTAAAGSSRLSAIR